MDYVPDLRDWEITRGDRIEATFRVKTIDDGTELPWDLTDAEIISVVRETLDSETLLATVTVSADEDQVLNKGVYHFLILPADSGDFPMTCFCDVRINDVTVQRFRFKVTKSTNHV